MSLRALSYINPVTNYCSLLVLSLHWAWKAALAFSDAGQLGAWRTQQFSWWAKCREPVWGSLLGSWTCKKKKSVFVTFSHLFPLRLESSKAVWRLSRCTEKRSKPWTPESYGEERNPSTQQFKPFPYKWRHSPLNR